MVTAHPPSLARAVPRDRPVAEVAVILGCSPDTVRTHLWRARTRLAEQLGTPTGDDGEPGGPAEPPAPATGGAP